MDHDKNEIPLLKYNYFEEQDVDFGSTKPLISKPEKLLPPYQKILSPLIF